MGQNGLHAYGNNSAESKPIWMRPGTVWAKCGGWRWQICDSLRGVVFPIKMQKLLTKFPFLATSGRQNSAMITNAENITAKWSPTGCLVSIFTVRIKSKSFPWAVHCTPERYLPKFLAIVDSHRGRKSKQTDVRVEAVHRCFSNK